MGTASSATLSFPDGPQLELDGLIHELVDRAHGVKRVQGRLRALLRAIEQVTEELPLDAVLRHVTEAACTLAGARYGALGVIGDDGGMEQFIHVGVDESLAQRIGRLPEGRGLLGAVTSDAEPIRLADLGGDPRSAGFPAHHPSMTSFLGVPIRVRGAAFGNLYLTESENGQFSLEDEELVRSLALAAAAAIARLYDDSRRQQRWLQASVEISTQLLADTGENPLTTIVRNAREIVDATLVSIAVVSDSGEELVVEAASGPGCAELIGRRRPLAGSTAATVLDNETMLLVRGPPATGCAARPTDPDAPGPSMVVALPSTNGVLGVLEFARHNRVAFNSSDVTMATGFAAHAGVALEFARARAAQQRVARFEDRDRIARDLHDHVIQQLFATGLGLESLATVIGARPDPDDDRTAGNGRTAAVLRTHVDALDRTILQIRTSIFELRGPMLAAGGGLRTEVLALAAELGAALGFAPEVTFAGQVDLRIDHATADDVIGCIREALTNVAKHAYATRAAVDLQVVLDTVSLTVTDDGRGVGTEGRRSGLDNLRARAETRGGTFVVRPRHPSGTELVWTVPIR